MSDQITQAGERFRRDTERHVMTVLHDDGLYRHLRFARPTSSMYWFALTTWPGALAITGDMGAYVFRRQEDMFTFFRAGSGWNRGVINPGYWAEKLVAPEPRAAQEFSEEKFRQTVLDHAHWAEQYELRPGLADAVGLEILGEDADWSTEDEAREALQLFEFHGYRFNDSWEWSFADFDHHFLWCCHAIQWGIEQYDTARSAVIAA